jgi:MoaA/NifB/PqqE/SkfB family radical SAM enzyme
MPFDLYERLSESFPRTGLIHLQGWGEPLLHPQFFEMVRLARERGCHVSTTTNGIAVGDGMADRLVSDGLCVVGFSLAGTDASQDRIREGAPLDSVLQAIKRLHDAKTRQGASLPGIHVAYLWLRSEQEAIMRLPALLEGTGVSQAVVSTLDYVPQPGLEHEVIQARDADEEAFLKGIATAVVKEGRKRGIGIVFNLVGTHAAPGVCTENVTAAAVVSCRGHVTPCVFKNLPLRAPAPTDPQLRGSGKGLVFGDLHEQSLVDIWHGSAYRAFRKAHTRGKPPEECVHCPKLFSRTISP